MIRRLVIISGTAHFCVDHGEFPGVGVTVLRAMARGLRRNSDDVLAAYYKNVHAPKSEPCSTTHSTAVVRRDCAELLQGLNYLQRTDLRDGLAKQITPTLVLHGRKDRIVPWQAGEWLSRALPVSCWHCYENYGHALPLQASLLVADDIRVFLEAHREDQG